MIHLIVNAQEIKITRKKHHLIILFCNIFFFLFLLFQSTQQ